MSIYVNYREVIPIIESIDFFGRDCIWYMIKYELYDLLKEKIID